MKLYFKEWLTNLEAPGVRRCLVCGGPTERCTYICYERCWDALNFRDREFAMSQGDKARGNPERFGLIKMKGYPHGKKK
jgi:hypothetical protein